MVRTDDVDAPAVCVVGKRGMTCLESHGGDEKALGYELLRRVEENTDLDPERVADGVEERLSSLGYKG